MSPAVAPQGLALLAIAFYALALPATAAPTIQPMSSPLPRPAASPAPATNVTGTTDAATTVPGPSNPNQATPLTISIDDLAGPKGPGSPTPKHPHWTVEPGYGWWGPADDFGNSLDGGWLW